MTEFQLPTEARPSRVSRRSVLKAASGVAAGGALAAARVKSAHGATQWNLASPMYANVNQSWHSGAIDLGGYSGGVYAYFRRSGAYGYVEAVYSDNSCDTPWNPSHQKLRFYCRTDGAQSYVRTAEAHHIYDIGISYPNLYLCPRYLCSQGLGTVNAGKDCFTGPHTHYWANGTQYGTPSGTVNYDSPVFWTWSV